jgi:predicted phage tail component-like protein
MANYNSGYFYNKKYEDGGRNYNSGPMVIAVFDVGFGADTVNPIVTSVTISDSGTGVELVSIAGAFFVMDSENILNPLGVLVAGDSRYDTFPTLKEFVEVIPGKHGEVSFGNRLGNGLLELNVVSANGMTPDQKEEIKRLCAKYLNPINGSKPLIFGSDIEKTYYVKYAGKIDPTQYADWLKFTIPFKVTNPYIVGSFEKKHIGSGTLVNNGNVETGLIIEISGSIANPTITIGDKAVTYTGTIAAGEALVIDTENMTAEIDGVNVLGNLSGDLPIMLQPGSTSVATDSNVIFTFRERWI